MTYTAVFTPIVLFYLLATTNTDIIDNLRLIDLLHTDLNNICMLFESHTGFIYWYRFLLFFFSHVVYLIYNLFYKLFKLFSLSVHKMGNKVLDSVR